ncbi:DUF2158 domain-containing protein [Pedobacter panaciterrae]|uniref:DUF2158 domain-containing protein n=1 Tax=Pedobacter panaciterrae TaxID=363849 RepID=A0ABU8NS28_9SPHI
MEEKKIKPGDLVKLKSGSPQMTVDAILGSGQIQCVWFSTTKNEFDVLLIWPDSVKPSV